ncbi:hypothetical protein VTI74DRAFT_7294 [Chaetomium olivicolor]
MPPGHVFTAEDELEHNNNTIPARPVRLAGSARPSDPIKPFPDGIRTEARGNSRELVKSVWIKSGKWLRRTSPVFGRGRGSGLAGGCSSFTVGTRAPPSEKAPIEHACLLAPPRCHALNRALQIRSRHGNGDDVLASRPSGNRAVPNLHDNVLVVRWIPGQGWMPDNVCGR